MVKAKTYAADAIADEADISSEEAALLSDSVADDTADARLEASLAAPEAAEEAAPVTDARAEERMGTAAGVPEAD